MKSGYKYILLNAYKDGMIAYVHAHPEVFDEAMHLALSDDQPYAWRSAWLLTNWLEENDPRVKPYIAEILEKLPSKDDNQQRDLLRILLLMDLDEKVESWLFDYCVGMWEKSDKKPAVRYAAFRIIMKIAKKYPELVGEIKFLVGNQYLETLSPGLRRSIEKLAKKLG